MDLFAPAKINLSLLIHGKRLDGFHEMESLMVPVSLGDNLRFEPSEHFEFSCTDDSLPVDESNLVVRTARAFFERTGIPAAVKIRLEKNIPHGAGLGGGSSDAATTLAGLNSFFNSGLSLEDLSALAAPIGSDIPFFLHNSAAICRGRGELVEPIAFKPALSLLLLKPPFGVPTPWAYGRWRDSIEIPEVSYGAQEMAWGKLVNHLERPVFEKYIFLAFLKGWLLAQTEVEGALMSGSGATMFAISPTVEISRSLEEKARNEFGPTLWLCCCQTIA
jgi:4-diphosphocytidyl-2-C-methyl-D-erythritol kinase